MTPEHEQAANARTALEAAAMSIGFPAAIDELTTRAAELQQWLDNNTPQWLAVEPTEPTMLDVLRQLFEAAAGDVRVQAWLDTATDRLKASRDVLPIRQMPPDLTEVREANVSLLHHLSTFVSHRPEISKWLSEVAAGVRTNTPWPMLATVDELSAPPASVHVVVSADRSVSALYANVADANSHALHFGGRVETQKVIDADPSELEEARSWARHGYEIAQRSATWSDAGVAPSWLTEGHDPVLLESFSDADRRRRIEAQVDLLSQLAEFVSNDSPAIAAWLRVVTSTTEQRKPWPALPEQHVGELPSAELPLWQVNTRHELEPPSYVHHLRADNGAHLSERRIDDLEDAPREWFWSINGGTSATAPWAEAINTVATAFPLREVRED